MIIRHRCFCRDDTSSSSSESSEAEQDFAQEQDDMTHGNDVDNPEDEYDIPWHTGKDFDPSNLSNNCAEMVDTEAQPGNGNSQTMHRVSHPILDGAWPTHCLQ